MNERDEDHSPRPTKRRRQDSLTSNEQSRSYKDSFRRSEDEKLRRREDRRSRQQDEHDSRQDRRYRRRRRRRRRSSDSNGSDHGKSERRHNSTERSTRKDNSRRHHDDSRSRSRERRRRHKYDDGDEEDEPDRERRDKRHTRQHRDGRSPRSRDSPPHQPHARSKRPLPSQKDAFSSTSVVDPERSALDKPLEKQRPNFSVTGKLAAASNTIQTANQTIVLKYHEPPEARKPAARDQWRLYVFKGDEIVETVELSEQSCWLLGREVAVADLPIEHPSCSKQHAVIQFRYVDKKNEFGDRVGRVKPYVIDLESANGSSVNGDLIPAAQYVELRDKDVVKFGHSSREYIIQLPPKS